MILSQLNCVSFSSNDDDWSSQIANNVFDGMYIKSNVTTFRFVAQFTCTLSHILYCSGLVIQVNITEKSCICTP